MIPRFPLTWPDGWPRARQRKSAKFSTMRNSSAVGNLRMAKSLSVIDGLSRVFAQLRAFNVVDADIVVSTNLALRLDGLPRSDQREPADPGVAVYWRKGDETKVMAIDLYDRVPDNLAAIAATLDAMRAIERHGGAAILERAFTGFDALPPPKNPFDYLGVSRDNATSASVQVAWKAKLRTHHPDSGGSHNLMQELNWARDQALKIIGTRGA